MLLGRYVYVLLAATLVLAGCRKERVSSLRLEQVLVGTEQLSLADGTNEQMPIDRSITLAFSQPVNQSTAAGAISLVTESGAVAMDIGFAHHHLSTHPKWSTRIVSNHPAVVQRSGIVIVYRPKPRLGAHPLVFLRRERHLERWLR